MVHHTQLASKLTLPLLQATIDVVFLEMAQSPRYMGTK